eukprot:15355129-Ditylum_brightwellii.AAC.1
MRKTPPEETPAKEENAKEKKTTKKNTVTSEEVKETIKDLRTKLVESQEESLEKFRADMQQEMARQMAIINKMQMDLTAKIQQIMNTYIAQMNHPAGTFFNSTTPPTPVMPSKPEKEQKQGTSSPDNTAVIASSFEQGSTASATS